MYKVLLVDDEPIIREGLRTLIHWEELGFEIMDTAVNGQEALQKCLQLKPDLLIADIRMPGMTGLELIKSLRDLNRGLHVLILSGYADFEYAQQAINYQIDGYLLKPVDEDELTDYLIKIREVLHIEQTASLAIEAQHERDMERAVKSLIAGERTQQSELSANAGPNWGSYEVILIQPATDNERDSDDLNQIKQRLMRTYDDRGKGIVFVKAPHIGIVIRDGLGDELTSRSIDKEISDACLAHVSDFYAVSGGEVYTWPDIPISYSHALEGMKERFFLESRTITRMERTSSSQMSANIGKDSESLLSAATDTLYLALEVGNIPLARQIIRDTAEKMIKSGSKEDEIKTRFVQIFSTALDKLTYDRPGEDILALRAGLMIIYKETQYLGLVERLVSIAEGMSNKMENLGTTLPIKRMIDLIHRDYSENLKLERLSEVFNYNSAYLGKLFKQATGEHFNTYLDKVRIERAKLLLEQGWKVYQVAEKVGYANVDYFHAKFRKYVGASPSSFKRT